MSFCDSVLRIPLIGKPNKAIALGSASFSLNHNLHRKWDVEK